MLHNSNHEKQVIPNGKEWHYLAVKKTISMINNSNHEKQVIPNGKEWHYPAVKKLLA